MKISCATVAYVFHVNSRATEWTTALIFPTKLRRGPRSALVS